MSDLVAVLVRTLSAYGTLFLLTRMMGKQVIAHLTFFEFVVGIMIGDIAAAAAIEVDSTSLLEGMVAMIAMAAVTVSLATLQIRSETARKILEARPTQLVRDGQILKENLAKERYTIQDLLSQLRLQQVFDISEVEAAFLEPNGEVSVRKKRSGSSRVTNDGTVDALSDRLQRIEWELAELRKMLERDQRG